MDKNVLIPVDGNNKINGLFDRYAVIVVSGVKRNLRSGNIFKFDNLLHLDYAESSYLSAHLDTGTIKTTMRPANEDQMAIGFTLDLNDKRRNYDIMLIVPVIESSKFEEVGKKAIELLGEDCPRMVNYLSIDTEGELWMNNFGIFDNSDNSYAKHYPLNHKKIKVLGEYEMA